MHLTRKSSAARRRFEKADHAQEREAKAGPRRLQRLVRPDASPAECVGALLHIVEGLKGFIDLYATMPIRVCNMPVGKTVEHVDATTLLNALKTRPDLRKALAGHLVMLGQTVFAPRIESENGCAVGA